MGQVEGFLKHKRQNVSKRPIEQRLRDYRELELDLTPDEIRSQAARCSDCGIPFCHGAGCPLGNPVTFANSSLAIGSLIRC